MKAILLTVGILISAITAVALTAHATNPIRGLTPSENYAETHGNE